jgi:hypothetical protein
MAFLRRVKPLCFPKADLYSVIAILGFSLYLSNKARTSFNGRYHYFSTILEKLSHAYLSANDTLNHSDNYNLMSISTPEGSWSWVSASIVLEVGPIISMSRL